MLTIFNTFIAIGYIKYKRKQLVNQLTIYITNIIYTNTIYITKIILEKFLINKIIKQKLNLHLLRSLQYHSSCFFHTLFFFDF